MYLTTLCNCLFRSDANVAVEEKEGFFSLVAKIELERAGDGQVRILQVEIHPAGLRKIVVKKGNAAGEDENELNVDTYWRYRLTALTMPELGTVVFVDGELLVMVPKDDQGRESLIMDLEVFGQTLNLFLYNSYHFHIS